MPENGDKPEQQQRADLDRVLETLRTNHAMLGELGVTYAAVFGSLARGDDRPDSDVDILVDLDPTIARSIFGLGRILIRLEKMIGRRVDLAVRSRLRSHVAVEAERDAVRAFGPP